ncbi:MAG: SOS response-associated peptidase [Bacteroidales bacterium]|nr:SOS response-associated peptidase [Bacteroidales bacterium]
MCFTVNVNLVKDELENRFGASFPDRDRYQPSYYYHAFGLPELPVVCSGSPGRIDLMKWGLIPFWTKNIAEADEIRYKTFNARAESLFSKPSFSNSAKTRRCLIPVKGFFEWQHTPTGKIPWYIYHLDDEIFSLAGIYDQWTNDTNGEVLNTFSVITTDANDMMAVIHNSKKRMPVILDRKSENLWLNLSLSQEEAGDLLKPYPSDALKAHTVSQLINSKTADKNTPEVIRPHKYSNPNFLF